jgi:hypothetical protein
VVFVLPLVYAFVLVARDLLTKDCLARHKRRPGGRSNFLGIEYIDSMDGFVVDSRT